MAFPALTTSASPAPGSSVTFTFNATSAGDKPLFAAFFLGLETKFVALDSSKSAVIPSEAVGTVYAVITTNGTMVSDDTTVAGPAIFEFRLPESARQTASGAY